MDDASLQWDGPDMKESKVVLAAAREFCREVAPSGLLLQPNKSGFVASSVAAEKNMAWLAARWISRSNSICAISATT
eukprot:8846555-Pyramimonas_sp.AAC.1